MCIGVSTTCKDEIRREIVAQVKEFIEKGGVIKEIPMDVYKKEEGVSKTKAKLFNAGKRDRNK